MHNFLKRASLCQGDYRTVLWPYGYFTGLCGSVRSGNCCTTIAVKTVVQQSVCLFCRTETCKQKDRSENVKTVKRKDPVFSLAKRQTDTLRIPYGYFTDTLCLFVRHFLYKKCTKYNCNKNGSSLNTAGFFFFYYSLFYYSLYYSLFFYYIIFILHSCQHHQV